MRFAITLDDDIAVLLRQEMNRSGKSLKQTVNDVLREELKPSQAKLVAGEQSGELL
ncbi:MAG TPA: hypothetical protein VGU46_11170 [Acidobacteriaceae bacterium]|nr:hypothetical protein [Acidobacteriaceae bacterium]